MKKEHKQIVKYLLKKELENVNEIDEEVIFPGLKFEKGLVTYKLLLKDILKDIK